MRLTPADVHNVAFKKPSIGKRGYDEDEVDAFLDLVEAELSRLIEENNELTARVSTAQAGGFLDAAGDEQSSPEESMTAQEFVAAAPVGEHHDHEAVEETAPEAVAAPVAPAQTPATQASGAVPAASLQAARLLGLAQETAERLTGEAAVEAESTVAAARLESEKLVTEAAARADELDRQAKEKYTEAMGQLTDQRSGLEKKIADLRLYEREYRSRLKSWITDQLSQLDDTGPAPTDSAPSLAGQAAE